MIKVCVNYFVFQLMLLLLVVSANNGCHCDEHCECLYYTLSLSTLVLNSRDWSEIVRLPEISRFKFNLAISLIQKKPAGMHWLGYNDAVSSLKEAKTQIFQPTANFENFKIRLYFVSLPASLP